MRKADYRNIGILVLVTLAIFYPLFYTHYLYTDESIHLWHYRKGAGYHMFAPQGRYLTDKLFQLLFSSIDTIQQITWLRIFSLSGWILCLPVWYYILAKVTRKEGLQAMLAFFSVLYLVTCPPFTVYVSWASCLELFIANTSGLLAGYLLYANMEIDGKTQAIPLLGIAGALVFGLISLFTYQNGFGCFLIPFLLRALAQKKFSRSILIAVGVYFFVYLVYFLLFRWELQHDQMGASSRTGFAMDIESKLRFIFSSPLTSAFHFTWIVNERSGAGFIVYLVIFLCWLLINFLRLWSRSLTSAFFYTTGIIFSLILIYLPSLVVKENYASNRTLLALDMAVFLMVATTALELIKETRYQRTAFIVMGIFFTANSWYNFHYLFLAPVTGEYQKLRAYIEAHYHPGITTVYFIRPKADFFQREYHITSSRDEFGMPSTFFEWVPPPFVRQIVFEKTGRRSIADSLTVLSVSGQEAWQQSGFRASGNTLIIDAANIISDKE